MYASFIRPVSMSFIAPTTDGPMDEVNDLSTDPYYVMAALGPLNENGQILEDQIAAVSDEPYILSTQTTKSFQN